MSKPLSGVRADNRYSYRDLEDIAARVRQKFQLAPTQPIDALRLFEDLHELGIEQGNVIIPLGNGVITLEDSEGYTRYDKQRKVIEILASERTYQWLEDGHPRASYFVTHELGHCLLHTDQLVRLAQLPTTQQAAFHRGRIPHKPFEDTEWQANAFASALLMPAQGIATLEKRNGGVLDETVVAEQFSVSREAAGYRLGRYNSRKEDLLR